MGDEWIETTLGACCIFVNEKADPASLPVDTPYVGLEHIEPGRPVVVAVGRVSDVTSLVSRFESGDTLFGRLRPYLRKVARADEAGVCSPEVLVLRANGGHVHSGFLYLMASSDAAIEHAVQVSAGSRMPRTSVADLASLPVKLPPIPVQLRIVDLMAHLDRHQTNLRAEAVHLKRLLSRLLIEHLAIADGNVVSIRDLCSKVIGGMWGLPEGASERDVLALGPRVYSPGRPTFETDGSPLRSFTNRQIADRLVRADDIILERSGGSPDQPVGRVVYATGRESACVPTDFQRLLRPDPTKVIPRYLYWRLQGDWEDGLTRSYSRRTTGITNLAVTAYLERGIPIPPPQVQRDLASDADLLASTIANLDLEGAALDRLRSCLLEGLLNGDILVDDDYDRLAIQVA